VTTVTCTVESEPPAEVTWLKDGEKIDDENQRIILNKKTLQLVDVDEEHHGSYTCKAENKLGTVEESVNISGTYFVDDILMISKIVSTVPKILKMNSRERVRCRFLCKHWRK
jgi:hypothetical protein